MTASDPSPAVPPAEAAADAGIGAAVVKAAPALRLPPALTPDELRALVLVNSLIPAVLCLSTAFGGSLGKRPVDFLLRSAGWLGLLFLLLSLAVTPLRRLTGLAVLGKLRRMLGLLAFGYASAHVFLYAVLDQGLYWKALAEDVISRPWVTVGFLAWVFMIPLAVTSTAGWVRRLGGKRWQKLHRRVYGIAVLAVIHYLWLVKADRSAPVLAAAALAALLGARLLPLERALPYVRRVIKPRVGS